MKFEVIRDVNTIKVGTLLLSEPYMDDPNFERTVILITEVNEDGYVGLVLNRPVLEVSLQNILEEFGCEDTAVFVGGPVEQNLLHFTHRFEKPLKGSIPLVDGLYFGGDFEELKILLDAGLVNQEDIRFFVGYSGWAKGQLEEELDTGVWIVSEIDSPDILSLEPSVLWRTILKSIGGKYRMYANYPVDPRLN